MDWSARPNLHHSDFYSNLKWVKMYDKIAHGNTNDMNEFEQEIASEMIRKGYVVQRNGEIVPAMPVYTTEQWNNMVEFQKQTVTGICEVFEELHKAIASVLKNHVPTHLKSQVEDISAMSLFHDGTYIPVSILNQNSYLSSEWTPNEVPTSYAVLK